MFKNCLSVRTMWDGTLIPQRFTPRQLAFYEKLDPSFYERALDTTGITMDFITNAPEISFHYRSHSYCRIHNALEVFENGVLRDAVALTPDTSFGRLAYTRREKEPSRITVFLPSMACARVWDIQAGGWRPAPDPPTRLLLLGDSITQGMTAPSPSENYPARLARELPATILNQAVAGFYFDAASLEGAPDWNPQIITVAFGVNDHAQGRTPTELEQAVRGYFARLAMLYPDARVFVISPIWRDGLTDEERSGSFAQVCALIARLAREAGFSPLDGHTFLPHQPALFVDDVHPTGEGFAYYAAALKKALV